MIFNFFVFVAAHAAVALAGTIPDVKRANPKISGTIPSFLIQTTFADGAPRL
jgi:hypothetical protein